MATSNLERYQRIAWAYDLLDLPFEYGRYRKIRPQLFQWPLRAYLGSWGRDRTQFPLLSRRL